MNPDPNQASARVVLYQGADGKVTVNVLFARDNFWLTQKVMAELFGVKPPAISKHLKNIFESGELVPTTTVSKMETVQTEGGREVGREVEYYSLDAVIAFGYSVRLGPLTVKAESDNFYLWSNQG